MTKPGIRDILVGLARAAPPLRPSARPPATPEPDPDGAGDPGDDFDFGDGYGYGEDPFGWGIPEAVSQRLRDLSDGLDREERSVVAGFLGALASASDRRGGAFDASALRRLESDVRTKTPCMALADPWLWPVKRSRASVAPLGALVDREAFAPGRGRDTVDALPRRLRGPDALPAFRERVRACDPDALRTLAAALPRTGAFGANLALNVSYVLACGGDRGAMMRIWDALERMALRCGDGRPEEEEFADLARVVADSWRRLSEAWAADSADKIDAGTERMALMEVDLRRLACGLPEAGGLVLGPPWDQARRIVELWGADAISSWSAVPFRSRRGRPRAAPEPEVPERLDPGPAMTVLDRLVQTDNGGREDVAVSEMYGFLLSPLPLRPARPADAVWEDLRREFPWMEEANEEAARAAAISALREDRSFRLPPMLVVGPPGVGKTRWARSVAATVGVGIHIASLSGVSTSKSVSGSERGWSNARPSLPALAFKATGTANPILFLDEADKASPGHWNGDVLSALLPMLEPSSADAYPDLFLLGNLDLTRVSFVLTANSLDGLPPPLLDRLLVVRARKPNADEFKGVAARMVEEVASELGVVGRVAYDGERIAAGLVAEFSKGRSMRDLREDARKAVGLLAWSRPGRPTLRVVTED